MKKTIERVLFSLFLSGTLLFSGCSTDDEEDELVGNWKKISDFEGVARCSAVAFTVNGTAYIATGVMEDTNIGSMTYGPTTKQTGLGLKKPPCRLRLEPMR